MLCPEILIFIRGSAGQYGLLPSLFQESFLFNGFQKVFESLRDDGVLSAFELPADAVQTRTQLMGKPDTCGR